MIFLTFLYALKILKDTHILRMNKKSILMKTLQKMAITVSEDTINEILNVLETVSMADLYSLKDVYCLNFPLEKPEVGERSANEDLIYFIHLLIKAKTADWKTLILSGINCRSLPIFLTEEMPRLKTIDVSNKPKLIISNEELKKHQEIKINEINASNHAS